MNIKEKLISAAIFLSGGINTSAATLHNEQPYKETTAVRESSSSASAPKNKKRTPQKVYHKFSEIPAISDQEAHLYKRSEYTYVIDAVTYQKTGKIILKRVLTAEAPSLNILSPTYYRECQERTPKPGEDPKVTYDLNPALINSQGYKGPTQMNDATATAFMKYLLANPKTRAYVVNFFQTSEKIGVHVAAANLEKLFFTTDGSPLPLEKCKAQQQNKTYTSLKIKGNVTDAYKKLAKSMPKKKFLAELEKYQLHFFSIGRANGPHKIIEAVATRLGYNAATRINLGVIAAAFCHVNWKGNGTAALNNAKSLRNPNTLNTALNWVDGKGINGVKALFEQTIITPQIIDQLKQTDISGANELVRLYKQAVNNAENKIKTKPLAQNNSNTLFFQAYMAKHQS